MPLRQRHLLTRLPNVTRSYLPAAWLVTSPQLLLSPLAHRIPQAYSSTALWQRTHITSARSASSESSGPCRSSPRDLL